jgi:hypothetical protein
MSKSDLLAVTAIIEEETSTNMRRDAVRATYSTIKTSLLEEGFSLEYATAKAASTAAKLFEKLKEL